MNLCSFTFDDGKDSQFGAIDMMNKLGVHGTFYLSMRFVKDLMPWKEAAEYGHEIGSHCVKHPDLTQLNILDMIDEFTTSQKIIEDKIGKPCRAFAYPYGKYNDVVLNVVKKYYDSARATILGMNNLSAINKYEIMKFNVRWFFEEGKMNRIYLLQKNRWIVPVLHNFGDVPWINKHGKIKVSSIEYLKLCIERTKGLEYKIMTVSEALKCQDQFLA